MSKKKPKRNFLQKLFGGKEEAEDEIHSPEELGNDQASIKKQVNQEIHTMTQKDYESFAEFRYLEQLIRHRLNSYYSSREDKEFPEIPKLEEWTLQLSEEILEYINEGQGPDFRDRATLLLIALAPHVVPNLFDQTIQQKIGGPDDFPKIGGVRGDHFRGFIPTGETALFLLAGEDFERRFYVEELFSPESFYHRNQVISLDEPPRGEPLMSGKLIISQESIDLFSKGKVTQPRFGTNFPARLIETGLEWENLVLPDATLAEINNLMIWIKNNERLRSDYQMEHKVKPGFRVLFYGPPGTGKTLTASLLGKRTQKKVYKIDLSLVISKYIGETEKNLGVLFDKARNKDWILFFDEADALFGKRTNIRDAHDKYANQEVSYLLQRTEDYPGLVILATNYKNNIDEAFARRFQSHVYFPRPENYERLKLWKNYIPTAFGMDQKVDLNQISRQYDLTGSNIANAVQHACLHTLERESECIAFEDLMGGIQMEYSKEGRIL